MGEPLIKISTDDRVIYTGATGTGKTKLAQCLILPYVPARHPIVVVDPKRDKAWRDVPDVEMPRFNYPGAGIKLRSGLQAFRWPNKPIGGKVPSLNEDRGYARLMSHIFNRGNVLVIHDESSTVYRSPHELDDPTDRLIREGRARNIGIWWLMQRPSNVPTIILTEAETWFAFTLRRALDRKTTADYIGDDAAYMVPQEDERSHFFWHSRRGYSHPLLMRLWLDEAQNPVKLSTYPQYRGELAA